MLYGRKPGRFSIGPARLNLGRKGVRNRGGCGRIRARSAAVTAGKARANRQRAAPSRKTICSSASPPAQGVCTWGQQLTIAYDLCSSFRIHDVAWRVLPKFSGFWAKDLFVAEQLDLQQETIGQAKFLVWPLRRHALFPTSSGTHQVQPLTVTCGIPRKNRGRRDVLSLFDSPFFGRSQSVEVRSGSLSVEVMPLPQLGRPAAFTGAVGSYTITAYADPVSIPVGEPVTLSIQIAGTGNVEAIVEPDIGGLEGFKVYEPKIEVQESIRDDLYLGSKSYEYILIPERAGSLTIPAVQFAYFDPHTVEYRTVMSHPLRIDSRGSASDEGESRYELSRLEIEELGKDIRHIKPDVPALRRKPFLHRSFWFWFLQSLMPLSYGGLVLCQRHHRRLAGDEAYARRRRAKTTGTEETPQGRAAPAAGDWGRVLRRSTAGRPDFHRRPPSTLPHTD